MPVKKIKKPEPKINFLDLGFGKGKRLIELAKRKQSKKRKLIGIDEKKTRI